MLESTSRSILGSLVRQEGLEPPRSYPLEPKSSASANFATSALLTLYGITTSRASTYLCWCLEWDSNPQHLVSRTSDSTKLAYRDMLDSADSHARCDLEARKGLRDSLNVFVGDVAKLCGLHPHASVRSCSRR